MTSFLSDWWEAFVISGCYEMGDPLALSEVEGNREGELLPKSLHFPDEPQMATYLIRAI
jgi:hypothetical protein